MTATQVLVVIVVVMALFFDFVTGWHDAANAIATVVGTRGVLSPLKAVMMAAFFNMLGAMIGVGVANTMAKMIYIDKVENDTHKLLIIVAGLLAAVLWSASTTLMGLPVSGTHSLVGGIIGSGVAAHGVDILVAKNVGQTLLFMLVAPVFGFFVAYWFYGALMWMVRGLRPSTLKRTFGKLQIGSAASMALMHGTNDAQKAMGIITLALIVGGYQEKSHLEIGTEFEVQAWVRYACATMISLGTAVGGWKVIKTLGHHLAKLESPEGFAAETSAAAVLALAAKLHIPLSTTHTITGSILGIGATNGISGVRWGSGKIVMAWVFTLPVTATLGGALYWFFTMLPIG